MQWMPAESTFESKSYCLSSLKKKKNAKNSNVENKNAAHNSKITFQRPNDNRWLLCTMRMKRMSSGTESRIWMLKCRVKWQRQKRHTQACDRLAITCPFRGVQNCVTAAPLRRIKHTHTSIIFFHFVVASLVLLDWMHDFVSWTASRLDDWRERSRMQWWTRSPETTVKGLRMLTYI